MSKYSAASKTRVRANASTPQTQPIPGLESKMVQNSAGGFTFKLDDFARLDRFLVLGTESNTYYTSSKKLTKDNAQAIMRAIAADGVRVVNRIVEVSVAGRAPKNDPAIFALALVMAHGNAEAKNAAYMALPKVARIGTHLLHAADYVNGMRGWGRGVRRAFAQWYNDQTPMELAMQMVKYANRDGWTHGDVLRLSHASPASDSHDALFANAVGKACEAVIDDDVAAFISAVDDVKASTSVTDVVRLVTEFQLPREVIPTAMLNESAIWEALLPHMGMTALVRNLATMTRAGFIKPMSKGTKAVLAKMADAEQVQKSRIHPIQVLAALTTYKSGKSARGSNTWTPVAAIVDALNEMFYVSFKNIVPTGKRIGLFLDVSGSMGGGEIAGVPGLVPRDASAAMAMVTLRSEAECVVAGFTMGMQWSSGRGRKSTGSRSSDGITELPVTKSQRLDDVIRTIDGLDFGGTNCSLPFTWALRQKVELDAFVIYTDNETYGGQEHVYQALTRYRKATGIDAKLIVVGMTATNFTIANPDDAGSLDVVGFDSAAPTLMADFIRGDL